jgi:hypothetical protein
MSNNIKFVLMYHRHKILDVIKAVYETLQTMSLHQGALRSRGKCCDFREGFSLENFVRHTAYEGSYDLLAGESRQLTLILKYGLLWLPLHTRTSLKRQWMKDLLCRALMAVMSWGNSTMCLWTIHDETVRRTMSRKVWFQWLPKLFSSKCTTS